jgi:hydroxymethylpyrimidine pyrophosphatase-like HAD family hydrolase/energy-coupling factor transporter ATP-binding protein EcfA2
MRFHALATDYDGTIAHDGVVDDDTVAALERARSSGRKLILVTGRELPELQSLFPRLDLFDLAVVENGAVVFNPKTKELRVLDEAPPPRFAEELKARGVAPVSCGHVIVATFQPHQDVVFRTIHDLGLELQVIFNKDAVMVLPSGTNKASGLAAALEELGLSPHNVVGVGDAENDHAFMRTCECSAAVANALPAVKETADIVMNGERGSGVAELIDRLVADDLADLKTLQRHRFELGEVVDAKLHGTVDAEGESVGERRAEAHLDPAGAGILVCGTSGSGKSTLTTALMERVADAGYQILVVDPEGDYTELEFATVVGNQDHVPRPEDVADLLCDPRRSVVVNLLGIPLAERPAFFAQLLPRVLEIKAATGRPHWLVVDEAHHMLAAGAESAGVATLLPDRGTLFVTVHPEAVDAQALRHVQTLLVIGGHPVRTVRGFCAATGGRKPRCPEVPDDKLPAGHAMLWRRGEPAVIVLKTRPPRTERKRHSRKYAEGNLGPERSFFFRGPQGKLNLKASNLHLFLQIGDGVDDETWQFHRAAGDFSNWMRTQIKDGPLADEVAEIEQDGTPPAQARAAVRAAVEQRYTLPADAPSGVVDAPSS